MSGKFKILLVKCPAPHFPNGNPVVGTLGDLGPLEDRRTRAHTQLYFEVSITLDLVVFQMVRDAQSVINHNMADCTVAMAAGREIVPLSAWPMVSLSPGQEGRRERSEVASQEMEWRKEVR